MRPDMLANILDWFGFGAHGHSHGQHGRDHGSHDHGPHGHTHGVIDPTIATTTRGIWAIKWSFVILAITAALQVVVVAISVITARTVTPMASSIRRSPRQREASGRSNGRS